MIGVDKSSLQVDLQSKSDGSVWGSAAAWCCPTSIRWNDEQSSPSSSSSSSSSVGTWHSRQSACKWIDYKLRSRLPLIFANRVTFPVTVHHRPLASTSLYCSSHWPVCEQLASIATWKSKLRPSMLSPFNHCLLSTGWVWHNVKTNTL